MRLLFVPMFKAVSMGGLIKTRALAFNGGTLREIGVYWYLFSNKLKRLRLRLSVLFCFAVLLCFISVALFY